MLADLALIVAIVNGSQAWPPGSQRPVCGGEAAAAANRSRAHRRDRGS